MLFSCILWGALRLNALVFAQVYSVSSIYVPCYQDPLEVLEPKAEPAEVGSVERVGHGVDVESEVHHNAEIESAPSEASDEVAEVAAVEDAIEDIESPSDKAERLKQEAKLAAEKAKAEAKEAQMEARRQQAAEKAAAKVKGGAL